MQERAARQPAHSSCPSCGNAPLPEFTEPTGLALCPRCGTLLQRTDRGLQPVGLSTEGLSRLVQARLRQTDSELVRIQERIRARVAEQLGVNPAAVPPQYRLVEELGADSLDVVELIMAVEEEFGIELGAL
jgi:acyl carrier protein